MRELFVYYRVRLDATAPARGAVDAMHAALRRSYPSLVARLLTRGEDGRSMTWMETYALQPAGVDARVERAIADAAEALAPFIEGERHVEAFDVER